MTIEQALEILKRVTYSVSATRQDHQTIDQAWLVVETLIPRARPVPVEPPKEAEM